jgi:hypothetical protein
MPPCDHIKYYKLFKKKNAIPNPEKSSKLE